MPVRRLLRAQLAMSAMAKNMILVSRIVQKGDRETDGTFSGRWFSMKIQQILITFSLMNPGRQKGRFFGYGRWI
jgi:hypothetical protein